MRFAFHKMHGLGNDFVVIDARVEAVEITPARARGIADRRTGIGCDQLILLEPSASADLRMRIFNADGGEVEQCGNALRCVAWLTKANTIETAGGFVLTSAEQDGARVCIGRAHFDWKDIPLAYAMDTREMPVGWEDLRHPSAVNVGNPHVVFFVDDVASVELDRLGPLIENDLLFPEKVNVNVATIRAGEVELRVWERGSGLTLACGTGACATVAAAVRRKLLPNPAAALVHLPGGDLRIDYNLYDEIVMTGPAAHVFSGEAELEAFG